MPIGTGPGAEASDPRVVAAALEGLRAARKSLPPWLFYDSEGCRLFYRITELPEYYLTRAERAPLAEAARYIAALMPPGSTLVEYGASDESKALSLLEASPPVFTRYIPIDVAAAALDQVRQRLGDRLPYLDVVPVAANFMDDLLLPLGGPRLGFFPGSTIGNLEPDQARAFLHRSRLALGSGARFLLGADVRKDPAILLPAYDDAAGVTAAFNLNLLTRLNREAAANFDLTRFRHQAVWNATESRIEMHLQSRADQVVTVAGEAFHFDRDETIHTENSYKHAPERMIALTKAAGWRLARMWMDSNQRYSVYFLIDSEC